MLFTKLSHLKISIIFFFQKSNDSPKNVTRLFSFQKSNEFSKSSVCFINFPFLYMKIKILKISKTSSGLPRKYVSAKFFVYDH